MKSWIWLVMTGLLTGTFPESAQAATSVAVLGVRALDGDTELERRLTNALRETASSFDEYVVGNRQLSLEQMALAHGCEEPDATCLTEVAATLGVQRLFWGTVVVTNAAAVSEGKAERNYELTLFSFEVGKGAIEHVSLRQLSGDRLASSGAAKAIVSKLLQRLTGHIMTGYIIVTGDAERAEIEIDGIRRGALDASGVFTLELPTGGHMVRINPRGDGRGEERAVRVRPGQSTRVAFETARAKPAASVAASEPKEEPAPLATPAPTAPRRSLRRILGWVSVGIGGVLAAGTIYSWVRLKQISEDPDWTAYRASFPRGTSGVGDVCREASRGTLAERSPERAGLEQSAKDLCEEVDVLEVAQYVLLGGALTAGGVGTYLLFTSGPRARGEVSLRPRFNATGALLEASAAF